MSYTEGTFNTYKEIYIKEEDFRFDLISAFWPQKIAWWDRLTVTKWHYLLKSKVIYVEMRKEGLKSPAHHQRTIN